MVDATSDLDECAQIDYASIIELATEAVISINADHEIIAYNRSSEDVFGYSKEEAIGQKLDLLLPQDVVKHHASYVRAFATGAPDSRWMGERGELRGQRKNGEIFPAEASIIKQATPSGQILTVILRDISKRKKAEEKVHHYQKHLESLIEERTAEVNEKANQLKKSLEREQEFNLLQQKFVALVSHEFRTPLTIIDGAAQRLIRRKFKLQADEVETRANTVRSAVTRMIGLIDTTLYASRLNEGKVDMDIAPCDIKKLLHDVCERQSEISPSHKIQLKIGDLPNQVCADSNLLDEVFTNLLSNAVKYAPNTPLIQIIGKTDGDVALVVFKDQGVGISKDDLPHMFERFFRAKTADGFNGTGLGLSVSKEFVEMHRGSISVDSEEGVGSVFTVHLPISGPFPT